ncbi:MULTISPECIES: BON domain-containing protein [Caldimonas]|uniref:BON domain-containing protein n=1 Tax=Caldimonas TaxID=196013 RepID=UPI0003A2DC23|nr:BON domain-containing protein [Caldimonas manganoxidans]GIX25537.1 MAG: transporter [Caldimonas sp.]
MQASQLLRITALSVALGATIGTIGCSATPTQASAGEVIDDAWITTKVKAAFVEDKIVSALNIQVETFRGTVQLSGFANSAAEVQRAGEIASGIKGVKAVKNDIRLKQSVS